MAWISRRINFIEKLVHSDVLPTTSQPSPAEFLETYKSILAEDPDAHIISVHISSALSGTYQSAQLAQNLLGDDAPVTLLDSRTTSYMLGWMAVTMAKAAADNESVEACVQKAERIRRSTSLYFLVDTLEYLQKGGRIGKAAAVAGYLLNIKPILSIDPEGEVTSVDKVRGSKRAIDRIIGLLQRRHSPDQEVVAFFPQTNMETGVTRLRESVEKHFACAKRIIPRSAPYWERMWDRGRSRSSWCRPAMTRSIRYPGNGAARHRSAKGSGTSSIGHREHRRVTGIFSVSL